MRRARAALRRFFCAEEASGRALLFARGLALWTGAYVLAQLPYLDELYCRPVLREGRFDRWFGPTIAPWPAIAAVVGLLLVALALVASGRGGRPARAGAAGLFLVLVGAEASAPRAYAELAAIQWILVALMPAAREAGTASRWATRLMMLQLSTVYVFAALAKLLEGTAWRSGDAVVLIFRSARQGQHLLSAWLPLAAGPLARAIAWSTIGIELLIGIGLWFARTRAIAALALVLLHLGIAATMRVSLLFHALMLLHLVLFVGPRSPGAGPEMPGGREGRESARAG